MAEVIQFRHKEPEEWSQDYTIWQCACGEDAFWLLDDGNILCLGCETLQTFRWFDPDEK